MIIITSSKTFVLLSTLGLKCCGWGWIHFYNKVQRMYTNKHKEKLLVLKLEFLSKHASKRKANVVGHGVVIGKW